MKIIRCSIMHGQIQHDQLSSNLGTLVMPIQSYSDLDLTRLSYEILKMVLCLSHLLIYNIVLHLGK